MIVSIFFFPACCLACEEILLSGERVLCTRCFAFLPLPLEEIRNNAAIVERLSGEVFIERGAAFFQFSKHGYVQKIMHKIKYENRRRDARMLARCYGSLLLDCNPDFGTMDAIVPVPLHVRRLRERGYNQSASLADGLADVLGKVCATTWLERKIYSVTQTKKRREERGKNVQGAFSVPLSMRKKVAGKRLLLVDDLITTGATLKECIKALLQADCKFD